MNKLHRLLALACAGLGLLTACGGTDKGGTGPNPGITVAGVAKRSEERRVGKECERLCRFRWLASCLKKRIKQKLQAEVERLNHENYFVLPKENEKARAFFFFQAEDGIRDKRS